LDFVGFTELSANLPPAAAPSGTPKAAAAKK